jgi:hypothetical protein
MSKTLLFSPLFFHHSILATFLRLVPVFLPYFFCSLITFYSPYVSIDFDAMSEAKSAQVRYYSVLTHEANPEFLTSQVWFTAQSYDTQAHLQLLLST